MTIETLLTQGSVSALLLELFKYIVARSNKATKLTISASMYAVLIPLSSVLAGLVLAGLAVPGFTFPTDWLSFAQASAQTVVASLVAVLVYNSTLYSVKQAGKSDSK